MVFVIHWHELAMDVHVFPIPIPPPTSLSTPSLWVFPLHQVQALVSWIQPGLVICFTPDNKRHVHPNVHLNFYLSISIPPHLALEYIYHFHFLYKQKDSVWRRILEPKSYRSLWVILIHRKNDIFFSYAPTNLSEITSLVYWPLTDHYLCLTPSPWNSTKSSVIPLTKNQKFSKGLNL